MEKIKDLLSMLFTLCVLVGFTVFGMFSLSVMGTGITWVMVLYFIFGLTCSIVAFILYKAYRQPPDPIRHAGAPAGYAILTLLIALFGWGGITLLGAFCILYFKLIPA